MSQSPGRAGEKSTSAPVAQVANDAIDTEPRLAESEAAVHAWQIDVPGFGEAGQRRLKAATVLVSRIGGLGGAVVWDLASAGIGRLILAHAGCPSDSDFNRQTLMRYDRRDVLRVEQAAERLREYKPSLQIETVSENMSPANADHWVAQADVVVDCAPMFEERLAMNDAAWRHGKPLVECAMYEMQGTVSVLVPGKTPCLRCLVPEPPPHWKRRFPVFGAVAATVGSLAAVETIKLLGQFGEPLIGKRLQFDLRNPRFHTTQLVVDQACPNCAAHQHSESAR
jgi:molybdopterin-synthase adenylyltransferase